jgi:hypothetical protein
MCEFVCMFVCMSTGSFPGIKRLAVALTTHRHLAPKLGKIRAIPVLPLWTFVACSRVNFNFMYVCMYVCMSYVCLYIRVCVCLYVCMYI